MWLWCRLIDNAASEPGSSIQVRRVGASLLDPPNPLQRSDGIPTGKAGLSQDGNLLPFEDRTQRTVPKPTERWKSGCGKKKDGLGWLLPVTAKSEQAFVMRRKKNARANTQQIPSVSGSLFRLSDTEQFSVNRLRHGR